MPRVFISYSHDSTSHCDRVLALAQQLRRDGIEAELDQFHQTELLHWPRWCEERMRPENADFVLCVCTAEYAHRVEVRVAADVGKGVFWEGTLIYNELYDAKGNPRCVPVLIDGAADTNIPRILQNFTWFRLVKFALDDDDYQQLYRLLTRQAGVNAEALGGIIALPPLSVAERRTDFGQLIDDIRAGIINIQQNTLAIRDTQAEQSAMLKRIAQSALTYRRSALHQLKPPPQHFTGRAEALAELCAVLGRGEGEQQGVKSAIITAVNGMGGVGKSALALMAGHALREDYPDMQLLLELRSHSPNPLSAGQVRDSVLLAANPLQRLPDDEDARWRLYADLFYDTETGQPMRALVVIDDAADESQVESLSPPPGCALLVTSRRQLMTGEPLHLDRLPRLDAMALLRAFTQRLNNTQADSLAAWCGDLPVALKTAGGYLKAYRSKPVVDYLAELEHNRLQRLANPNQPADDVNLIFDASFRALTDAERRAWTALSVMPADFDREGGKAVIAAVVRPGWFERLLRRAPPDVNALLDRFVHLNLLDYAEDKLRYGWHDLLREFAAARLPTEQLEPLRLGHAEYHTEIAWQAQELYQKGHVYLLKGLALFDQERIHLEAAFSFLASDSRWSERLVRLVDGLAYTGNLRFHPRTHIRWLETQALAARRVGDQSGEGRALGNMGICYSYLGEYRKALECYDQCLVIAREFGDRRDEGISLGNMGLEYWNLGEIRKALEYYDQSLVIAREIGNRRGEGKNLGNMGLCYNNLGEYRKALEYQDQYLVIAREIGDRRGEGNALCNMGICYSYLGEYRKALEYLDQSLVIAREIGDRRGEGNALGNMGRCYSDLDENRKALEYQDQSLVIAREIGDRFGEGQALCEMGTCYGLLGEYRKALEYHDKTLVIAREFGDRLGEGNALWNSALDYDSLGERAKALPYAEQVLAIYEDIEDPNAAKVRETLARWRGEDGGKAEA